MNDTYCRISSNSLRSANLTQFLVSKLKERLGTDGSMIYKQQWKQKVTPSGIVYWAHTASARRTSGSDCTGWRTPKANESEEPVGSVIARRERLRLKGDTKTGNLFNLSQEAQLSGWPTPSASNALNRETDAETRVMQGRQVELTHIVASMNLSNGSTAETTNIGQLNPGLSRWLMGFPVEWCIAAIRATRKKLEK